MGAASEETFAYPFDASPGGPEVDQAEIERRADGAVARLQRVALVPLVASITFANGVANLYFALNPLRPARRRMLGAVLPLEFFRFPRSFILLIGFALIISAINVCKRKRRAFQSALALSTLSVIKHLLNLHTASARISPSRSPTRSARRKRWSKRSVNSDGLARTTDGA